MNMNTDIYKISEFVQNIQKKYIDDVNEDTLMMGIFGYLNETHSSIIQNSILTTAELANEAFATRAKYEKSILSYAMTYNIKDIYAIPAYMDVMIGFLETDLINNMTRNKFILDRDIPIKIQDIEFHIDYDIIINRNVINKDETIYSAIYDIQRPNPLSDITNPYLSPPIYLNINGDKFVFITCRIRQLSYKTIYKKIITNNILENKTIEFNFDSQFANFEILVKDPKGDIYLTPLFEGAPLNGITNYCHYSFLDYNTIRVKFDRNSYIPKINTDIIILLKTTLGSKGIFSYNDDIIQTLSSDKINYTNMSVLIKPISDSMYGFDGKSINNLREIFPKEILARGSIITNKDLQNFFNNLDSNKLFFFKRRDNQLERLYYAYMLLKDDYQNVIPTNTLDVVINDTDFDIKTDERLIINPGKKVSTGIDNDIYTVREDITDIAKAENEGFLYSSPFIFVINKNPLTVSYYLNVINESSIFNFKYINQNSPLQFITSSLSCCKNFIENNNIYSFDMKVTQNINVDYKLISTDESGNIIDCKIKPVIVLDNGNTKYYKFGEIIPSKDKSGQYSITFKLETDNLISLDNRIRINNIMQAGYSDLTYSYFDESLKISVLLYTQLDQDYGRADDNGLVPNLDGYTLCNIYETINDMHLFYNYSNIINSFVKVTQKDTEYVYNVKSMPLVRYSYITNKDRCMEFIKNIQYKKVYIDEALKVLENSFEIDLKFFNTYGKSKTFKIGHGDTLLDRVNLTLNFKVKLSENTDTNTPDYIRQEVKKYIEDLNELKNIHMTNLTTVLTSKFKDYIDYIEFVGINNYNALFQYLERIPLENIDDVPEFVNINTTIDQKSDINIYSPDYILNYQQQTPNKPICTNIDERTISLTVENGCKILFNGNSYDSPYTFTELYPNTEYTFYAYRPEQNGLMRSYNSDPLTVKTLPSTSI